ncbi:uncharacterized protein LOC124161365 [Ischnura elegans]|uniref:uncharacterized protein LOC124161365 n=1 Tax=Ischnura elegans TaxID=197161 RepID=UPI001ED88947|nr:uncharacterized protein LOC124161365 [Ischnura elegans]
MEHCSWQDIKCAAEGKAAALKKDIPHTWGGPQVALELYEFQRWVANIIGTSSIQGYSNVNESVIVFDKTPNEIPEVRVSPSVPKSPQINLSMNEPDSSTSAVPFIPLIPESPSASLLHHQFLNLAPRQATNAMARVSKFFMDKNNLIIEQYSTITLNL